jgi:hypothetical protein
VPELSLADGMRSLRLKLFDQETGRMAPFPPSAGRSRHVARPVASGRQRGLR